MKNKPVSLTLECVVAAASPGPEGPSARVVELAVMFGLGADQSRTVRLIPPTDLTLRPGQLVFITGPSGGGKSTLLRLIREAVTDESAVTVIDFADAMCFGRGAVVDEVDGGRLPLPRVLRLLSLAGLNDAFVMLRKLGELSDGQRYRFRLARVMAEVELDTGKNPGAGPGAGAGAGMVVVLADEFGATLDRTTAAAVAANVRRWVDQHPRVCFVAATTHDDLLEALNPDVLIEKQLGVGLNMMEASP